MKDTKTALVIGSSIAGLLAAKVLSDHGIEVTLVDQDDVTDPAEYRRGAPQAHHPHYLLERGAMALEEILPGLRQAMVDDGVPVNDFGTTYQVTLAYDLTPVAPLGITVQAVSRPFIERHIRAKVMESDRIRQGPRLRVDGLVASGGRVRGVHGASAGERRELEADLTVDATGRTSKLPQWLGKAGLPEPPEQTIPSGVSYITRWYEGHPDMEFSMHGVLLYAPRIANGGGLVAVDGDRTLVILFNYGRNIPNDEETFLKELKEMGDAYTYDFACSRRPLGPGYKYVDPGNSWRKLHRTKNWPKGLIAIGDTIATFNPVYAQGMTVAALQALSLRDCLARGADERAYLSRCARIILPAWLLSGTSDLAWQGENAPLYVRIAHSYLDFYLRRAVYDPVLYKKFASVQHMIAHPASLGSPRAMARALRTTPWGKR